jgi:hypothetical protein
MWKRAAVTELARVTAAAATIAVFILKSLKECSSYKQEKRRTCKKKWKMRE